MSDEFFKEEQYGGRMKLHIWGRLLKRARGYRRHVIALVVIAAVCSACDNLFPFVTRQVIDDVTRPAADGSAPSMWLYGLEYAGLILGFCLSVWAFIYVSGRISTGLSHDIRKAGFERLQELSFSYFDRRPVGWLVARLTSDCDRLSRIIAWGAVDLLISFWVMGLAAVFLVLVNWRLALLVLAIVPPLVWISLYFKKRLLASQREIRRINSRITAAYSEGIAGVRTTKSLVREEENSREFRQTTGQMYGSSIRNAILAAIYVPIVLGFGSLATALALWAGGGMVVAETISVGTLILFLSYSGHMTWPVAEVARVFSDMQAAQAAAERVLDLLETEPEVKDSPEVLRAVSLHGRRPEAHGVAPDGHPATVGEIEFRNVDFAYDQGKPVLRDFSLKVRPGETIALVGPTGGGKTTIVSLLCRFYEPTGGQILIGGVDYRQRSLHWLQSNLGVVLQTPHLFRGTVRENIRYGRLDADDDEVAEVAARVNAQEFITGLEEGYESEVGESGGRLSRGQQQLVSLARAVLADPQILVMDEATSSVDTRTEQLIQRSIEEVLRGRTSFVIAHRLSTIRSADRILFIDDGRIVEEGNHHGLIRLRGRYYELYTNQFTHEREEQILEAAGEGPPAGLPAST